MVRSRYSLALSVVVGSMAIGGWAASPIPLQDADPPATPSFVAPELDIDGPAGQTVMVYVRYYRAGQPARTVGIRHTIDDPREKIPLDLGLEGIRIWLVNPSHEKIALTVRDGDRQLGFREGTGPAALELSVGRVPREDAFRVPRVLLDRGEQEIVHKFVQVLRGDTSRPLLAAPPLARVDWPTLDAFAAYVRTHFGTPGPDADDLDGWLSWEGEIGTRILHGRIEFPSQPEARFSLVVLRDRVIQVEHEGLDLPDDWFLRPADASGYVGRAERLTYLLATGRTEPALAMFSPSYREGLKLTDIQGLVDRLKAGYGQDVRRVEFKQTVVGGYDFEVQARPFYVDHAVQFESDKRCICRVTFMFPCSAERIARGHLAMVHFSETWPSASPELAALARRTMEQIDTTARSSAPTGAAPTSMAHLPWSPQIEPIVDAPLRDRILNDCMRYLGPVDLPIDWDLWSGNADLPYPFLEGHVQFAHGAARVRIDLLDDGVLGITILSDRWGDSTLRAVSNGEAVRQHARQFWTELASGDIEAAHSRLAEPFARQLTLAHLGELVDRSGIGSTAQRGVQVFLDGPMISNRPQRLFPVMVATCGVLEIESAPPLTVLNEYRIDAGVAELFDFSSEVEALYPVADQETPQRLVDALADVSGEALFRWLDPADRAMVVPAITRGFLAKLHASTGAKPSAVIPPAKVIHAYHLGKLQKRVRCRMACGRTEVPLAAQFEFDALKALQIDIPDATGFLDAVDMPAVIDREVPRAVAGLANGDRREWSRLLVPDLQTPETLDRLEKIQAEWRGLMGEYQSVAIESVTIDADANTVQVDVRIQFSKGYVRAQLDFDVDIFAARLAGIAPLPRTEAVGPSSNDDH